MAHKEIFIEFYKGARISLLVGSGNFKADSGYHAETIKALTLEATRKKIDETVEVLDIPEGLPAFVASYSSWEPGKPVRVIGVKDTAKHGKLIVYRDADGKEGLANSLVAPSEEIAAAYREMAEAKKDYDAVNDRLSEIRKKAEEIQKSLIFGAIDVAGMARIARALAVKEAP